MTDWRSALKKLTPIAAVNAWYKAISVEHEAVASIRRHEVEARKRNVRVLRGSALAMALRARVGLRATQLGWPKPVGTLHLFLCFGVSDWESVLPNALAPFGEVTAFDWHEHGYLEYRPGWLQRRNDMNRHLLAAFHSANSRRPVDIVVAYASGYTIDPESLLEMARCGAVITNFCFDDKHCFPGERLGGRYWTTAGIASAVDLNLTSDPNGILKYAVHGGLAMFHPEAASLELHHPYNFPFEYDVSFIGANYGWRPRFIQRLTTYGIDVTCFGKRWANGAVTSEEMAKIYSRSRINLGFGGIGHSYKLMNLKGRDFEVPMSGGLYLTQHNPELALVYDLGTEIVTYRDESDCARTILELLANPDRAEKVRTAGHRRALREHTYEARWTKALRMLGAIA